MMEQVILNLGVNARDAMPHGGQLCVTTQHARFGEEDARDNREARAGEFVCLKVTDTGTGIALEVLPRIFEPFFTTKDVGRGTGLGLATVYGIKMTGHDLAERLWEQRPGLRVIFMSGYSADVLGTNTAFIRRTKSRFLTKPCSSRTLLEAVRQSLGEKKYGAAPGEAGRAKRHVQPKPAQVGATKPPPSL
jgi:DNA-binding NarL/FixJ family response regulator